MRCSTSALRGMLRSVRPVRAVGAAGRDRPAETNDPSTSVARPSKSTTRRAKAFVILPATQRADDGLWTESERGEVLVGTRKARRRQQRSHARWRRVMSLSGVDGTSPTDVQARIAEALQAIEDERQTLDQALRKLERGSKSDVAVSEVKRLKKLKLACKDDAARLRKAASMAAEARTLGEGSFGRVFLGRDVDTGIDVAIKVEDSESVETEMVCESLSWDSVDEDTHPFDDSTLNDDEMVCNPKTPLTREHDALRRVVSISGQMGLPRVHFFGEQRVLGDAAKVLVMDLLGPSLEDMSWRVAAGGPLSRLTTLMVCDQALERIHAVHEAGYVHRDVKPDNLLLGLGEGGGRTIHLVDFGLAAPGPSRVEGLTLHEGWAPGTRHSNEVVTVGSSSDGDGTPRYSSIAADAGRPPTYADDLESVAWTVSYLRAGTTLWVPPEVRGDIDAVIAGKATAEKADVATEDVDAGWMWALMAHARGLRFGERFDLELCRGVVAAAFAEESGGLAMRDVPFDWEEEEEGAEGADTAVREV